MHNVVNAQSKSVLWFLIGTSDYDNQFVNTNLHQENVSNFKLSKNLNFNNSFLIQVQITIIYKKIGLLLIIYKYLTIQCKVFDYI